MGVWYDTACAGAQKTKKMNKQSSIWYKYSTNSSTCSLQGWNEGVCTIPYWCGYDVGACRGVVCTIRVQVVNTRTHLVRVVSVSSLARVYDKSGAAQGCESTTSDTRCNTLTTDGSSNGWHKWIDWSGAEPLDKRFSQRPWDRRRTSPKTNHVCFLVPNGCKVVWGRGFCSWPPTMYSWHVWSVKVE